MAAVAQSQNGTDEVLVRAAARACLQEGLKRNGTTYTFKPVECGVLGLLIKAQGVPSSGKLATRLKNLGTPETPYFKQSGKGQSMAFLANLSALIKTHHRSAAVQAILLQLNGGKPSVGSTNVITVPRSSQGMLGGSTAPSVNNGDAGGSSSSQPGAFAGSCRPSKDVRRYCEK